MFQKFFGVNEVMLRSIRVGVWCALSAQKKLKIFLFFFKEELQALRYVNSEKKKIKGLSSGRGKVRHCMSLARIEERF